jgi:hypothetical protein
MIEKISSVEKEMMEFYIDEYANKANRTVNIDYILRVWDKAKSEYLNEIFKDNLILTKEIEYVMEEDELFDEMDKKLSINGCETPENIRKFFREWNNHFSIYNYNYSNRKKMSPEFLDMMSNVHNLLNLEVLVKDRWIYNNCEIKLPEMEKSIKIQYNARPIKIIRKFAELYNIDGFEAFRIRHSQILNQKRLKGDLHLSIHPLDYMTMSDNNCDWSSCMSWIEEGCYRQGTVEMMNSAKVVVAYLTSSTPMEINGEKWNNKKWRQLFIITPEAILNVKGYPYRNDFLTAEVLKWLKELAEKANIGTYCDNIIKYDHGHEFKTDLYSYDVVVRTYTNRMYNDFNCDQFGFFTTDKDLFDGGYLKINYSGPSECMSCGSTDCDFSSEEFLNCLDCYSPKRCSECGEPLGEDDGWLIDGEWFCEDCLDSACYFDKITEEYHICNTGEKTIYVASNNGQSYYTDFYITIEDYTFNNYLKKYCLVDPHQMNKYDNGYYYIRRDELTEDGLDLFFGDEYWSYSSRKVKIPTDEEMLNDCFIRDLPEQAA